MVQVLVVELYENLKEVNFDVDGDNDEKIKCCFKDLDFHELENLKVGGH
jgi:hypothetical protein